MCLDVVSVRIVSSGRSGRYAVIYFKSMSDVNRALERAGAKNGLGHDSSSSPVTPNSGVLAGAEAEVFLANGELIEDK